MIRIKRSKVIEGTLISDLKPLLFMHQERLIERVKNRENEESLRAQIELIDYYKNLLQELGE